MVALFARLAKLRCGTLWQAAFPQATDPSGAAETPAEP